MPASESFTAELAALLPRLPGAIERDNTGTGRAVRITGGLPVNEDVLHAMVMLHREIPPASLRAAAAVGEPWPAFERDLAQCLHALARFAGRLHDLRQADGVRGIEDDVRRWTRVTKLALGMRRPEMALADRCPVEDCPGGYCGGELMAAGAERFLQFTRHGVVVGDWVEARRIYCTADREHEWPFQHWTILGGMILAAAG